MQGRPGGQVEAANLAEAKRGGGMRFTEADRRFARECVKEAERHQAILAERWGTPEALARRWREYRRALAYWRAFEAVGKRRRKQRERELNRAAKTTGADHAGREPGAGD